MGFGVKFEKVATVILATSLPVLATVFFTDGILWPIVIGFGGFLLGLFLVIKNKHEWLSDILSAIASNLP